MLCDPALLADSGPATPWIAPLPNSLGSFATFFSIAYDANDDSVAPPPGSRPRNEPSAVPRTAAGHALRNWAMVGHRPRTLLVTISRFSFDSRLVMISAKPNRPIATLTTPRPSVNSGTPNEKRAAPELTSVPTMPSSRPSTIIAIALSSEPCASTDGADQPQHHQREVFGGAELERELRQRDGHRRDEDRGDASGEEGAERRGRERRAGLPLTRHLVAVEAGHRGRGLARHVEQDRRRRAAVLRAVVDAGEHDQRRNRLQRVRGRQQHGDGRHRADPRQHADQRAQQRPDERVDQVDRRQRDRETQRQVMEDLHPSQFNAGRTAAADRSAAAA